MLIPASDRPAFRIEKEGWREKKKKWKKRDRDGCPVVGEIYERYISRHPCPPHPRMPAFYACTQTSPRNAINSARGRQGPKVAFHFVATKCEEADSKASCASIFLYGRNGFIVRRARYAWLCISQAEWHKAIICRIGTRRSRTASVLLPPRRWFPRVSRAYPTFWGVYLNPSRSWRASICPDE